MTPLQTILDIFEQAVELPVDERQAFLSRACSDPETLRAVEEMLAVDEDASPPTAGPEPSATQHPASSELPDGPAAERQGRIGSYRLLRRVGQGGMSTVYLASRDDDTFRRHVVIKLVREGMERETILRRLRIERQILAGLDHPYIARLYDGGSTEDGLPYFVMEYVEGLPIDAFCEQNRLSVGERLRLFRKVCAAVQFAHRNLVVHRDIKPSNILVTADGTPKLLDFGIAKLLDPDVSDSEPTAAWHRILTPSYASPEQLTGRPITTASDVYSLGVLLYKMLTGRLPRRYEGQSPHELESELLDSEPLAPSRALADASDVHSDHPNDDHDDVEALRRRLHGDLDAVALRALRTAPSQRYGSVGELMEDLERHENGLPVTAREGGWRYRAGKFVRRHRVGVAVAVLAAVLLTGFVAALAVQSVRVAKERDQARLERDEKQAVLGLFLDIFRSSHPYMRPGEKLTVHEALQRSVPVLESGLHEQPAVRAALLQASGVILSVIGENQPAERQLEEALAIRRRLYGEGHGEVLESMFALADARKQLGKLDEAESLVHRGIEWARMGGDERGSDLAAGLLQLASIYCYRGDFRAAEGPSREALSLVRNLPKSTEQSILAHEYMAQVRSSQGRYDEAATLYREALAERRRVYGDKHPSQIAALSNLGLAQRRMNDFEAALDTYRQVRSLEHASFGDDYNQPITLSSVAGALFGRGDYADAQGVYAEAVDAAVAMEGPESWRVLLYSTRIEQARVRLGAPAAAETNLRSLLATWKPRLGDDHARIAQTQSVLGESLSVQGKCEEAEPLLVGAYRLLTGAKHRLRSDTFEILRDHLRRCGRASEIAAYEAMLGDRR